MNILPKKRWHVRTKDNIARVRRDEANARDEESKRLQKLELAESEARINFLRNKSGLPDRPSTAAETKESNSTEHTAANTEKHIDLFADYKSHIKQTNKESEKEKKEEQEKYEKQIGYLTYLGQDTNEALKLRSWYEVAPKRFEVGEREIIENDMKNKFNNDPLTLINTLIPPEKHLPVQKRERASSPTTTSTRLLPTIKIPKIVEEKPRKTKKHKKEKKHKKDKQKNKKEHRHKAKKREKTYSKQQFELQQKQQKQDMLEKLRKERLRREATERAKQEKLLAPKDSANPPNLATAVTPRIVQKYNSQFNPDIAKQNMI